MEVERRRWKKDAAAAEKTQKQNERKREAEGAARPSLVLALLLVGVAAGFLFSCFLIDIRLERRAGDGGDDEDEDEDDGDDYDDKDSRQGQQRREERKKQKIRQREAKMRRLLEGSS
ncbi:uncharacterized protein ARB_05672 [Trichophyton benhamiae CBS 112371]|uniref:Uncharacterized protein n=1 Tax=Arthroderma benhamiae (strain ATCC MYA-4681 / CBS 112371) TaxID=663331 RepID=D4AN67_ARTBC|nr:uncharacterized protein ARB_05672 [Trichophyton benhamiae CBS 112371]EFE35628.1 hypothetical protein ARB_05672 [Trichophyton benhamiae CBS 112371]